MHYSIATLYSLLLMQYLTQNNKLLHFHLPNNLLSDMPLLCNTVCIFIPRLVHNASSKTNAFIANLLTFKSQSPSSPNFILQVAALLLHVIINSIKSHRKNHYPAYYHILHISRNSPPWYSVLMHFHNHSLYLNTS